MSNVGSIGYERKKKKNEECYCILGQLLKRFNSKNKRDKSVQWFVIGLQSDGFKKRGGNTLGKRIPFGNSSRFFDSVNGEIRYSGFHERHVDVDN